MDVQTIEKMASFGESETVEFKKSTSGLTGIGESLCAFLNTHGGQVFVGVGANGKLVGQHITDSTLRTVATMLSKLDPPNMVKMQRLPLHDEKEILVLTADPIKIYRPFTFDGKAYQRVGSTTSLMPQFFYQRLLLEKAHSNHRWESEVAIGYQMSDLDHEEILRTMRLGLQAGRIPESVSDSIPDILDRLEVRKNGQILNAAIVLFGTKFFPDYPQCQLRLARFKGLDKSEFLDQNQLQGNAFSLLQEAMIFLRRHLPVAAKILPDVLERRDEPFVPFDALREALVNALCHRTYMHPGGAISIAIFDNRLEIWSDGALPFNLKPDDLKRDHQSHPRNPIITNVFYRRGLIEQWGRGTQKIIELCVKAGHPEPEFFEQAGSVIVRFFPKEYVAPHRISHDLTARQREVLHILSQANELSFADIKGAMTDAPADRTLQDDMYHLKRLTIINSKGHGRGARWHLIQKTNNAE
jgi:ATP-dependent DNA helicase RecG